MSHTVKIQAEFRDLEAIRGACRRLKIEEPVHGRHRLFSTNYATGQAVKLPDWYYPLVIDTTTGQAHTDADALAYDRSGSLGRFRQAYAAEKLIGEARKAGHTSIRETVAADGSIKISIGVMS